MRKRVLTTFSILLVLGTVSSTSVDFLPTSPLDHWKACSAPTEESRSFSNRPPWRVVNDTNTVGVEMLGKGSPWRDTVCTLVDGHVTFVGVDQGEFASGLWALTSWPERPQLISDLNVAYLFQRGTNNYALSRVAHGPVKSPAEAGIHQILYNRDQRTFYLQTLASFDDFPVAVFAIGPEKLLICARTSIITVGEDWTVRSIYKGGRAWEIARPINAVLRPGPTLYLGTEGYLLELHLSSGYERVTSEKWFRPVDAEEKKCFFSASFHTYRSRLQNCRCQSSLLTLLPFPDSLP